MPFLALPAFAHVDLSEWKTLFFQEMPTYSSITFLMNIFLLSQLPISNYNSVYHHLLTLNFGSFSIV